MALDPRVKRFLDVLATGKKANLKGQSVAERRRGLADLMALGAGSQAPVAREEELSIPGPGGLLAAHLYAPQGRGQGLRPALVYLHGGGLVAGSVATHAPVARALARAGGCGVLSVDYRLAPEHPYPAALEDSLASLRFAVRHAAELGFDPARMGIAGDSAGATLAAVTCQELADAAAPRLVVQLLLCPILDYQPSVACREALANGHLVDGQTLAHDLEHYLPADVSAAEPRVSPLRGRRLAPLPRTLIHSAEYDPLRSQAEDYANRLEAAGTQVSYTCHPGMIHLFYGLGGIIPYARIAFEGIGAELKAVWGAVPADAAGVAQ